MCVCVWCVGACRWQFFCPGDLGTLHQNVISQCKKSVAMVKVNSKTPWRRRAFELLEVP